MWVGTRKHLKLFLISQLIKEISMVFTLDSDGQFVNEVAQGESYINNINNSIITDVTKRLNYS